MTRTQRILGLSGICLLLSTFAGCYFNRETFGGTDADNDGWEEGADCNDDVPTVYPGAAEVCGNGFDDDCDGKTDFDDPECQSDGIGGSDVNPTTSGTGGAGQGGDASGGAGMGGSAMGGNGQGGQGLGVGTDGGGGTGGDASGGAGQGGSAQGGSAQGGSAQGGSAQGGSAQGGAGGN